MSNMKSIEAEITTIKAKWNKTTFNALTATEKEGEDLKLRQMKARREIIKKEKAGLDDVLDSLTEIATALPDVDISKAEIFSGILVANQITKWELYVATAEVIRSRTKFIAVAEYFLAINRLKARLQASGHNIFSDNALDF